MSSRNTGPLIDIVERGTVPAFPEMFFVVRALGFGPVDDVFGPLCQALKHPNVDVRSAAAQALVRLRTKKAIGPLVEALGDRSRSVKFNVVMAVHSSKFFRTPKAIGPLKRIVGSALIKRQSPGLWQRAQAVLAELERRHQRPE